MNTIISYCVFEMEENQRIYEHQFNKTAESYKTKILSMKFKYLYATRFF